jgi:hypothetical protein
MSIIHIYINGKFHGYSTSIWGACGLRKQDRDNQNNSILNDTNRFNDSSKGPFSITVALPAQADVGSELF